MSSVDQWDELTKMVGMTGLLSIVVELLSIYLMWIVLQEVKWEVVFRFPRSTKARMFQVLMAVILGHWLAQFILQYWSYSYMLKTFIE